MSCCRPFVRRPSGGAAAEHRSKHAMTPQNTAKSTTEADLAARITRKLHLASLKHLKELECTSHGQASFPILKSSHNFLRCGHTIVEVEVEGSLLFLHNLTVRQSHWPSIVQETCWAGGRLCDLCCFGITILWSPVGPR